MIREERAVLGPPPLHGPAARPALELEPPHEDLVDALQRLREAGQGVATGVEVAAQDRGRFGRPQPSKPVDFGRRKRVILGRVEIRDDDHTLPLPHVDSLADTAVPRPVEALAERKPTGARLCRSKGPRVQADDSRPADELEPAGEEQGIRLAGEERSQTLWIPLRELPCERTPKRQHRDRGDGRHAAPRFEPVERPDRNFLECDHVRAVLDHRANHLLQVEGIRRGRGAAVEEVPGSDEEAHGRDYCRAVRVTLVDPGAFTIPYDHALASALARRGLDVELVTSRFRFGKAPDPHGYRRRELFYPVSSRVFGRSRLRLPVRAAEHLVGLARLRRLRTDVLHVQWAPLPPADLRLLPLGGPSVITAHDVLPRRWASRPDHWRRLYGRFDRVIVHSEHGRNRLVDEVGVERGLIRVIPHPVFPGSTAYQDDGRTILFVGVIQPYKQLDHVLEAAARIGARTIVAGDPATDVSRWRNRPDVEWRLGYLDDAELDDALHRATVAVFAYRQELDQSGALLRTLGSGVPAVTYDVGGMAEPVRRFGAGAVVPADDREALAEAARQLLEDADALARAREGARRAAAELTWEAAAVAHEAVYEEITR
jgi:glycosyltransferase involved in cell wall biosynthesis